MTVLSMLPHDTPCLPARVTEVTKDVLRNFPHSKKVGNYLLGATLGEGSFAKVKEALHIPTGERVAVKIIDKKKTREDSYVRKNLRREGKILQMVRHTNVVQLLEIMETLNSYYLVTELCRGGDLMDYISKKKRLSEIEVKKYIYQIMTAVNYLHKLGILHRDLKIENLLLDEYKDIRIIDFGLSNCVRISRTRDGTRAQDLCTTQCGSPAYAAPELLGRQKYGQQVDVWSIGVNMYAMLTGNLPFTVEPFSIKALHSKMLLGDMNPLPDGTTKDCRDLIKRLLTPDPDRRICLDDALKHTWFSTGARLSPVRSLYPPKLSADMLNSSILQHMSENQGYRLGEVIRYVTGNVPSSATAMYYLIQRRLSKHVGEMQASGMIAADTKTFSQSNNKIMSMSKRPHVENNRLTNSPYKGRTIVTRNRPEAESNKTPSHEVEGNHSPTPTNGACPDRVLEKHSPTPTSDKSGIVYASSSRKTNEDNHQDGAQHVRKASATSRLPRVSRKYIVRKGSLTNNEDKSKEHARNGNQVHGSSKGSEDSFDHCDENEETGFRKRASTFPAKRPRPKIDIDHVLLERDRYSSNNSAGGRCKSVAGDVIKPKLEGLIEPSMPSEIQPQRKTTLVKFRNKGYHDDRITEGHLSPQQQAFQRVKQANIQRRIYRQSKTPQPRSTREFLSERPDDRLQHQHIHQQVTTRMTTPSGFHRDRIHTRTSISRNETFIITSHVSEISANSRPVSVTSHLRTTTPALPALSNNVSHELAKKHL